MLPWLDPQGRLWGKWNILDAGLVMLVACIVLGMLLVQLGVQKTSAAQVLGESDILIKLYLRSRTFEQQLFVEGEKTNITVRNQPRGEVTIMKVEKMLPQLTVMGKQGPQAVPDASLPGVYDYTITLKDHATLSKEGYVAEGVKIKIGLPIELEGQNYRLTGSILQVTPVNSTSDSVAASAPHAH